MATPEMKWWPHRNSTVVEVYSPPLVEELVERSNDLVAVDAHSTAEFAPQWTPAGCAELQPTQEVTDSWLEQQQKQQQQQHHHQLPVPTAYDTAELFSSPRSDLPPTVHDAADGGAGSCNGSGSVPTTDSSACSRGCSGSAHVADGNA